MPADEIRRDAEQPDTNRTQTWVEVRLARDGLGEGVGEQVLSKASSDASSQETEYVTGAALVCDLPVDFGRAYLGIAHAALAESPDRFHSQYLPAPTPSVAGNPKFLSGVAALFSSAAQRSDGCYAFLRVVAEVEPPEVEAFADWMFIRPVDRGRCGPWGPRSVPGFRERLAVAVGEHDRTGSRWVEIGVARDAQATLMVHSVMLRAQADEVPRIGGPILRPVDDVVDLDETVACAPRDAATAIAVFDEASGAVGNDVL